MFDAGARMLAGTDLDGSDHFPEVPRALTGQPPRLTAGPRRGRAGRRRSPSRSRPTAHAACSTLRRSLESLGGVQAVVRRSLVAAAFVALAVALVAGIALATRLVRRLSALRTTALEVAERGPGRHAAGRGRPPRRGRRPRPRVRDDAAAARGAGAVAAHVRQHRLARAAHAADLARADAARRDRGARPRAAATCPRRATSCAGRSGRPTGCASSPPSCSTSAASTPASSCAPSRSSWSSSPARCSRSSPPATRAPSSRRTGRRGCSRTRARSRGSPASCSTTRTATANGRVVVRVDAPARIEVSDDGPGVPPGEEERIFERFRRGPEAGEDGGFGLGLAIGRELAEQMGGELRLVGDGATFRATFPRRRGRPPELNRAGPSQHGPNMMLTTARSPRGTIGRDARTSPPISAIRSSSP